MLVLYLIIYSPIAYSDQVLYKELEKFKVLLLLFIYLCGVGDG